MEEDELDGLDLSTLEPPRRKVRRTEDGDDKADKPKKAVLVATEDLSKDALFELIPEQYRKDLVWYMLGNADMLVAMLSMLSPVCTNLSFCVKTTRADTGALVSGLHVDCLVQDGAMFVSAQLPCDVRFVGGTGCGQEFMTVCLADLLHAINRKGGSSSLVLFQVAPEVSTDLFAVCKDGTILRGCQIKKLESPTERPVLPEFQMLYRLTVPVGMLREEMAYAFKLACAGDKLLTLAVQSIGDGSGSGSGSRDDLLLVLSSQGVGGAKASTTIYLQQAGHIGGDSVQQCFEQSRDPLVGGSMRFADAHTEYTDSFYGNILLSILRGMRCEGEVDIILAPGKPLVLRVSLGERPGAGQANTSYIAFVIAPQAVV